jgi:hypothetical protein
MTDPKTRRRFLQGTGSLGLVALAGCTSGDSDTEDGTDDSEMTADSGMDGSEATDTEDMDEESSMDEEKMSDDEETMAEPVSVTVRIENVAPTDFYATESSTDPYATESSTDGQIWITPGAYGIYTGEHPIFTTGEPASIGLEALAEAGPPTGFEGEQGLLEELQDSAAVVSAGAYTPENTVADPNDPMGAVPGAPPIAPGGAFEFDVEVEPGQRLAFASMFVPSNDLFVSPAEGILLWPEDGEPVEGDVTDAVSVFDAGTEPNGEPGFDSDQAPAQDDPRQGADEDSVVRPLDDVDDGHEYPAVEDAVQVTVTRN